MKPMKRSTSDFCEMGTLERMRYFPRQLITPVEMTLEQTYFRDKLRRHNRLLHGWGVVCGAEVCAVAYPDGNGWQPWKVRVRPGYALAPTGDEIVIGKDRILDLRVASSVGGPEDLSSELVDPWCRPVYRENLPEWVYIAVRYREIMTRQVRAQPAGCGCDDASCEYSRVCDGYEFGILPDCPDSHQNPPALDNINELIFGNLVTCPECPEELWVVLAAVRHDEKGQILAIDNCFCRRIVVSFANVWSQCAGGDVQIANVDPREMEQGQGYDVVVTGANFHPDAAIDMGKGVTISNRSATAGEIRFHVDIGAQAAPGPRVLVVTNPDCSMAIYQILVKEKPGNEKGGKVTPRASEGGEARQEGTGRRRRR